MPLSVDTLRQMLRSFGEAGTALEARTRYLAGVDDPFAGVLVQPLLKGVRVPVEPKGPFKSAEDAANYLEAKRRAHGPRALRHFADGGGIEHDGQLFSHPDFTYELLTLREYYATGALQIMSMAQALLYHTISGQAPAPVPLAGVPLLDTPLSLATDRGKPVAAPVPSQEVLEGGAPGGPDAGPEAA